MTAEQLVFGALTAALIGVAFWPLGDVLLPWKVLSISRIWTLAQIVVYVLANMVRANVSLSRRIWSPSRPLHPGMLVVPTNSSTDGQMTAIGVLTSLIVDNQIVDLDPDRHRLQYHAVSVESDDPDSNRQRINGPLEDLISSLSRPGEG
jgi:multicomponent Na+:H+ antiporter subunit E